MAKVKYDHQEVISGLLQVFRNVGYEGASLEDLAKASGMKKSSLYHRFPGGKEQMATEALEFVGSWVRTNITDVLKGGGEPIFRLNKALKNINALYDGGKKTCMLRAISLDRGMELFQNKISNSFDNWIEGFKKVGVDLGFSEDNAAQMAEETLIKVQGSLVVSKGMSKFDIFQRELDQIKSMYLRK